MLPTLLVALAFAAAPPRPSLDLSGDPLPRHAVARLGALRYRAATPGGVFALSHDGKRIALGEEGRVRLLDAASGRQVGFVELPKGQHAHELHFAPNGRTLAVGVGIHPPQRRRPPGGTPFLLVDLATGKSSDLIESAWGLSWQGGFLEGGRHLVHLGTDPRLLAVRDTRHGKLLRNHRLHGIGVCSPDGKMLVTDAPPDAKDHKVTIEGVPVEPALRLWDASTGKLVRTLAARCTFRDAAFSPCGRWLFSAGSEYVTEKAGFYDRLILWEVATGKQKASWLHPRWMYRHLQVARDGRHALAHAVNGPMALIDLTTQKERVLYPDVKVGLGSFEESEACFSADGSLVAWKAAGTGTVHLHDLKTDKERHRWTCHTTARTRVAFSPDGKTLFANAYARVHAWDTATGKETVREGHRGSVTDLVSSPSGDHIVTRADFGGWSLWQTRTGKPISVAGLTSTPYPPAFVNGGKQLAIVGNGGHVRLYSTGDGRLVRSFSLGRRGVGPREGGSFFGRLQPAALDFSQDGRRLAFSVPGGLRIWDLTTGQRLACLDLGQEPFRLSFSSDSKRLFALCNTEETYRHRLLVWPGREEMPALRFAVCPETGKIARSLDGDLFIGKTRVSRHDDVPPLDQLEFDPSGSLLLVWNHIDGLSVRDAESGAVLRAQRLSGVSSSIADAFLRPAGNGRVLTVIPDETNNRFNPLKLIDLVTGRSIVPSGPRNLPHFLSPDGRLLVSGDRTLTVREMLTGDTIGSMPCGHLGAMELARFSLDSSFLATAGLDTTALVHDWRRACGLKRPSTKLDEVGVKSAWDALGGDTRAAWQAMDDLIANDSTSAFVSARLKPIAPADCKRVRDLLRALASDDFPTRMKARDELGKLPLEWLPLFDEVLASKPDLALYREAERLSLLIRTRRYSSDTLRRVRAVAVLERIGDASSRRTLQSLAEGEPRLLLTREAKVALRRLRER